MTYEQRGRGARFLAGAAALVLATAVPSSGARPGAPPGAPHGADGARVEQARAALEKWVESRRIASAERRDWALGRELLHERIALVQREIDALRASIREAEQSIAAADAKRVELAAESEALERASVVLAGAVAELEAGTRELVKRLPEPLRERVRPLTQQFHDEPAELGLSQRYQNIVGTLNAVNKFNREVSAWSEVRTLADGRAVEVTALYLGIGQGWYVNANGDLAGIGTAEAEAWTWQAADAHAAAIAEAVAVQRGERPPAFVRLPIRVQ